MQKEIKVVPVVLVCAVALTRFWCRSHQLYDIDSVNFALGLKHFDPRAHQPHPPGYFLYICLGRLVNLGVHNANQALVLLSIAASCGTVYLIYILAADWFGESAGRFAGLLFLFSPLAWFHGIVALTYSVEAFFSTLIGYLCWRMQSGNRLMIAAAGVTLGISAGVRPSSLLFLGPLYLFSLRTSGIKNKLIGLTALLVTLASWFLPMIRASGGLQIYFGALHSLWRLVPSKDTVLNSSPSTSIARAFTIILIYLLCFGVASIAPLMAADSLPADRDKRIFTIIWATPALLFFTFVFLRFINSGYLLLLISPMCVWLGFYVSEWYSKLRWAKRFKVLFVGACALMNVLVFLYSPFYCSYSSVRSFEKQLDQVNTALPLVGSAGDTLVIGFDSHFLGYRHAGYYLPGYTTIEYPEVKLLEGMRVFAMHGRNTALLTSLPSGPYHRFVFVPLPEGDPAYREYLQKVIKCLPPESLTTVRINEQTFISGPVSDLTLLFPQIDPAARNVYIH